MSIAVLSALLGCCAAQVSPHGGLGSCSKRGREGGCTDVTQEDFLLQAKFKMHTEGSSGDVDPDVMHSEAHNKHMHNRVRHPDDWMYETSFHNEWLASADQDADYASLSDAEKKALFKKAHKAADEILSEGGEQAARLRKAWKHKFQTEHRRALHAMEHHVRTTHVGQQPCERHEGAGGIAGLYTFGAPGTALVPLNNVLRQDGKFPGLRLVTKRITTFANKFVSTYHDPVPFLAGVIGMRHPHMDLLVLPVGLDPEHHETSLEVVRMPRSDMGFWVNGHWQTLYHQALKPHKDTFDPKAWTMLHMSRAVSPGDNDNSRVGNAAWAAKVGWNLVAQSMNEKLNKRDVVYRDNTSLFQDPATKACTLAFVGTHHLTQWLVNLRFNPGMFCGIPNVHIGFRDQVRRVIRSSQWSEAMLPALDSCPELYITGHSLGAAQAQLVAACLQRAPGPGELGWEDYKYLVWTPKPEAAKVLPPLVSTEEIAALARSSL